MLEAVHGPGGACVVTADHGNADHMLEPDGSPNTAHSLNPVPLVVTADVGELRDGGIARRRGADGPRPARPRAAGEMTGSSLIQAKSDA